MAADGIPEGYWWPLDLLLQEFRPGSQGDDWTWEHEHDDLWLSESHQARCDRLAASMQTEGQRDPITLGPDGRVWDGHHRIVVAMRLGIDKVLCDTPPPSSGPDEALKAHKAHARTERQRAARNKPRDVVWPDGVAHRTRMTPRRYV